MGKNRLRFLLSMMRFDDKAPRAERRLNDKLAAFHKIWDMFVEAFKTMYLVGASVCIDEQLLPFRGRCPFWKYMPNKPNKYGIKIWMMSHYATKYMMNSKVYWAKKTTK